jgi:hypothetical protein
LHRACQLPLQALEAGICTASSSATAVEITCQRSNWQLHATQRGRPLQLPPPFQLARAAHTHMLSLHHALHYAVLQDSTTVLKRSLAWMPS